MPRVFVAAFLTAVSFMLLAPASALAQETELTAKDQKDGGSDLAFSIAWNKHTKEHKFPVRIPDGAVVSLRIKNFNYLRYTPLVDKQTKEVPQYRALEALWGQFLGITTPPGPGSPGAAAGTFLSILSAWRDGIANAREALAKVIERAPTPVKLADDGVKLVEVLKSELETVASDLEAARLKTYKAILTESESSEAYYAQVLYDAELKSHTEVAAKLQTFLDLASDTQKGRVFTLGPYQSGTYVTVSIRVAHNPELKGSADQAADEGTTTIKYLVTSKYPVVFHVGPAFTSITDFSVEKVRAGNDVDLFQLATKPKEVPDAIAFMSYELAGNAQGNTGIYLTIGTGLRDTGDRLYFGGTARLPLFFLTVGGFVKEIKEGAEPVTGNLFKSLQNVRKLGFFFSISMSPF